MAAVLWAGPALDHGACCLEQVGFRGGEVAPSESTSSVNPRMHLSPAQCCLHICCSLLSSPGVLDAFWQLVFGCFSFGSVPLFPPFIYNYNICMAAAASVPRHWKELFLICSDEQQRQLGKGWHCARVDPCSWLWVSCFHLVQRKWSSTTRHQWHWEKLGHCFIPLQLRVVRSASGGMCVVQFSCYLMASGWFYTFSGFLKQPLVLHKIWAADSEWMSLWYLYLRYRCGCCWDLRALFASAAIICHLF